MLLLSTRKVTGALDIQDTSVLKSPSGTNRSAPWALHPFALCSQNLLKQSVLKREGSMIYPFGMQRDAHVTSLFSKLPLEPLPYAKFCAPVFRSVCDNDTYWLFSPLWLRSKIYSLSFWNVHTNQLQCISFSQPRIISVPRYPHVWWQRLSPSVSHVRCVDIMCCISGDMPGVRFLPRFHTWLFSEQTRWEWVMREAMGKRQGRLSLIYHWCLRPISKKKNYRMKPILKL